MESITKNLIKKYVANGPRYTSYPTAVHFSENENKKTLTKYALEQGRDCSLYIHIPFCKSLCWFCACTSELCLESSKADEYLDLIDLEFSLWQKKSFEKRNLVQIHFGGGTPNFLNPNQILRLNAIIEKYFDKDVLCEFSVELDPRTLTKEKIEAFAQIGVNRASIGLQDSNAIVQKAINRIQPMEMNIFAFETLRKNGIEKINIDLMYGLPLQTIERFSKTLEDALSLNPDRIALFSYAHVPWMKVAQKILERKTLPSVDEKVECFLSALDFFTKAKYEYIGLDHFAKSDDELINARRVGTLQRNFQGYSTCANVESFGAGLSSISQTKMSYRQNFKDMAEYTNALKSGELPIERGIVLNQEDDFRRKMIFSIMCNLKLDTQSFADKELYAKIFDYARDSLEEMQNDSLVLLKEDSFEVTLVGRIFLRNIAMLFDGRQMARHSSTL